MRKLVLVLLVGLFGIAFAQKPLADLIGEGFAIVSDGTYSCEIDLPTCAVITPRYSVDAIEHSVDVMLDAMGYVEWIDDWGVTSDGVEGRRFLMPELTGLTLWYVLVSNPTDYGNIVVFWWE